MPVRSIISLVAGVGSVAAFICPGGVLFGVVAVIAGVYGRKREPNGRRLATAGIILGAIGALSGAVFTVAWIARSSALG